MMHLEEMRYNDDFVIANRIMAYKKELKILEERAKKPRQYPDNSDRIEFLSRLIRQDTTLLSEKGSK